MDNINDTTSTLDTPMQRKLFVEMTPTQQNAFLEGIRERRLRVVHKHTALLEDKRIVELARTEARLNTALRLMDKDFIAAEKAMEKVEARMVKVAALKAMLG